MLFSTINIPDDIEDVENKLRLNLSDHAFATLRHDTGIFQTEEPAENRIPSSIINQIFACYRDASLSSVASALEARRTELEHILVELPDCEVAIQKLLDSYREQLLTSVRCRLKERGNAFSIRVDKQNLEYLRTDAGQAEYTYYDDRVGLYIKAVIEEYCEQPYAVREKVFYRENCNAILSAIESKNIVKLKLRSKSNASGRLCNNISYMQPICIEDDTEHLYNYVAGMMSSEPGGPWKPASVRLSQIQTAERQRRTSSSFSAHKKLIYAEIKKRGIQYLSGDPDLIRVVVRFTHYGELQYRKFLHLRPEPVKKDDLIYEFECSDYQAESYFFKFGENVKILEPQTLADKFKQKYETAAACYQVEN